MNIVMNAPAGFGGFIEGMPSGNLYTVPASGAVTVAQADIGAFAALGFQPAPNTVANIGLPGVGITSVEYGTPYEHQTVLTLNTMLGAIAGGASLGLGITAYTLPAGMQIVESSSMNVAITQTQGHINADTPKVGLGSVVASGAVAVLSGTATFMDILTQQTAADCNGTPTAAAALATSSPFAFVTLAAGAKAIHFNAAFAWAASGDAAAEVTGQIVINWRQMS